MTLGVLMLHGFTSDDRSLHKLRRAATELNYQVEVPLLRGHGQTYHALYGMRWEHWLEDAQMALDRLRARTDNVIILGYSMGGLLALDLASSTTQPLAGVVVLAPALYIAHPLAPIAWMARGWYRFLPMGKSVAYSEPGMAAEDDSYSRLATDAFVSFYRASHRIRRKLGQIQAPLLLLHSLRDRVIKPRSSQFAYNQVNSTDKQLIWLHRTGHAMLDDCESETVVAHVRRFLLERRQPQWIQQPVSWQPQATA